MRDPTEVELIVARARGRRRTEKPATILGGTGSESLACTLLDLSDTGARISYVGPEDLPASFRLRVGADRVVACIVAWRHRDTYGLKFGPRPI